MSRPWGQSDGGGGGTKNVGFRQSTRVCQAPGGNSSFSFGSSGPCAQVRSSVRSFAPPGGGSSFNPFAHAGQGQVGGRFDRPFSINTKATTRDTSQQNSYGGGSAPTWNRQPSQYPPQRQQQAPRASQQNSYGGGSAPTWNRQPSQYPPQRQQPVMPQRDWSAPGRLNGQNNRGGGGGGGGCKPPPIRSGRMQQAAQFALGGIPAARKDEGRYPSHSGQQQYGQHGQGQGQGQGQGYGRPPMYSQQQNQYQRNQPGKSTVRRNQISVLAPPGGKSSISFG